MRGFAALSVVIWHWQHFFYSGTKLGKFSVYQQPFFKLLYPFYMRGLFAVDLFFCLSGFVFYWLYSKKISENKTTLRDFSILRFSRLYPLHFVTLLIVAVLQFGYRGQFGTPFVYPANDAYHFVLNLFFAQSWGLEKGYSFNSPTWSVSVEVLLYALFFVLCKKLPVRAWLLAMLVLLGMGIELKVNQRIGWGITSFFTGGLVYLIYEWIVKSGQVRKAAKVLPILAAFAWLWTLLALKKNWYVDDALAHVTHGRLLTVFQHFSSHWTQLVVFPLTILSLATMETVRGTLGKRLAWVGELTYSSYLIHFPMQLIMMWGVMAFAIDRTLFEKGWFMIFFFAVIVVMSLASTRLFEMPAQRYFRKRFGQVHR